MFRFFKILRNKYIKKGEILPYLKYAIGEIVLVVIGILIALTVNSWNDKRIKNKKEAFYLEGISNDLHKQMLALESGISTENYFIEASINVLKNYGENGSFDCIDEVYNDLNVLIVRSGVTKISATYDELVSTGDINLIQDDVLRAEIIEYYRDLDIFYKNTGKNHTNLIDRLILPSILGSTVFDLNSYAGENRLDIVSDSLQVLLNDVEANNDLMNEFSKSQFNKPEVALQLYNLVSFRLILADFQKDNYKREVAATAYLLGEIETIKKY